MLTIKPVSELREGDHIVMRFNKKTRRVESTSEATTVVHNPRGCRGHAHVWREGSAHVECYDYCATIMVLT